MLLFVIYHRQIYKESMFAGTSETSTVGDDWTEYMITEHEIALIRHLCYNILTKKGFLWENRENPSRTLSDLVVTIEISEKGGIIVLWKKECVTLQLLTKEIVKSYQNSVIWLNPIT